MIASHVVRASFFALSILLLNTPASSQAALQSSTSADSRITLDVVVNDKSGSPVKGLSQQDFTVFDNKQPEKLVSFQAVTSATAENDPLSLILVIYSVNTSFTRVAYARDQTGKFLRQDGGKLSRPISIAYLTDTGFEFIGPPSTDGNALAETLAAHTNSLRSIRRSQGYYGAVDRNQLSLRALGDLAQSIGKKPGRKIVVWISPGWPLLSGPNVQLSSGDERNIFRSVVAASTELRDSRITLYNVDPLGTFDAGGFRTFYYREFTKGIASPKQVQIGDLALQVLAYQSGGRVLNSSNDVADEIAKSTRDATAYYVLSYEAPRADGPDEYHALEVKVVRKDLKTQTRTGYYAQPAHPPA